VEFVTIETALKKHELKTCKNAREYDKERNFGQITLNGILRKQKLYLYI
jgi:hypothetical protein